MKKLNKKVVDKARKDGKIVDDDYGFNRRTIYKPQFNTFGNLNTVVTSTSSGGVWQQLKQPTKKVVNYVDDKGDIIEKNGIYQNKTVDPYKLEGLDSLETIQNNFPGTDNNSFEVAFDKKQYIMDEFKVVLDSNLDKVKPSRRGRKAIITKTKEQLEQENSEFEKFMNDIASESEIFDL